MSSDRLDSSTKQTLIFFIHGCIAAFSLYLAFLLRFDFNPSKPGPAGFTLELLVTAIAAKLLCLWYFGLHRGWWRTSASLADILRLAKASALATALLIVYCWLNERVNPPRSVLFLDLLIFFIVLSVLRFLRRAIKEHLRPALRRGDRKHRRLLVLGAGNAGELLAREMRQNIDTSDVQLVGFLDDDPDKERSQVQGFPILGPIEQLPKVVKSKAIDELVIAIPSASRPAMQRIVAACRATDLPYKTLPNLAELITAKSALGQLREVDISDLLSREEVRLDLPEIERFLCGKTILVTGAAGSIGSEICRQVARFRPQLLILVDHAETPLFFMENSLRDSYPDLQMQARIASVRDRQRMAQIFAESRPQVVFHAAAYKHVPMMEANPVEALLTNVLGTSVLAELADAHGVERFVMVSTDKAVRPTSVMGASKRIAEIVVQGMAGTSRTAFVTVRFGNVLGSNGSVIPIFREQIRKGGPVTVTHPEMTRFFMTIPEASQLVLQAGSMGRGGEIFILDMGEPVRIASLAEDLIRLKGLVPHQDIQIVYTGLRPGEKLYEELLLDEEGIEATVHPKIVVAKAKREDQAKVFELLDRLKNQALLDEKEIPSLLETIIGEYRYTPNFI